MTVPVLRGPLGGLRRRVDGTYTVDEWGLDHDIHVAACAAARLRWSTAVEGAEQVPATGGALLVANQHFGLSEPFVLASALSGATGRHVRFTGISDLAPFGPAMRSLGGVLARADEVRGLLLGGHVVAVFAARSPRRADRAGVVHQGLVAPALEAGVPVLPVAVTGNELGRSWRVDVGPPVPPRARRGPLAGAELADDLRAAIQELLDDRPLRWPFGR